jgi:hypothetical protein
MNRIDADSGMCTDETVERFRKPSDRTHVFNYSLSSSEFAAIPIQLNFVAGTTLPIVRCGAGLSLSVYDTSFLPRRNSPPRCREAVEKKPRSRQTPACQNEQQSNEQSVLSPSCGMGDRACCLELTGAASEMIAQARRSSGVGGGWNTTHLQWGPSFLAGLPVRCMPFAAALSTCDSGTHLSVSGLAFPRFA